MSVNQAPKPKLLVVTTTFPRWENDTDPPFVFELSKRLTRDFQVFVHTPHYPGSASHENICGIEVHRFRYFLKRFEKIAGESAILSYLKANKVYYLILPFFLLSQFVSLFVLVKKVKPDVIHAHWLIPNGFFSLCCTAVSGRVPVLITCHGSDVFGLRTSFFRSVKKWSLKNAEKVTVVSKALLKEIHKLVNRQSTVEVLPMGVCAESFNPEKFSAELYEELKIDGVFLLFVGKLTEQKGLRYLLEAFSQLKKNNCEATLVIVGGGDQADWLRHYADDLAISGSVRFVGPITNKELPSYYATADVFVGPSMRSDKGETEGLGLTFIEAGMSGCFLIGSKIGGITDIIVDKKTGLLFEPGNSNDLKGNILWFLEHPDASDVITKSVREYLVRKFEWKVVANRYSTVLRELINNT